MNQIETFFDTMAERWDAVCVHDPGKIRTILDRPTCGRTPASSMSVAARGYWKVTCCRTNPAKS